MKAPLRVLFFDDCPLASPFSQVPQLGWEVPSSVKLNREMYNKRGFQTGFPEVLGEHKVLLGGPWGQRALGTYVTRTELSWLQVEASLLYIGYHVRVRGVKRSTTTKKSESHCIQNWSPSQKLGAELSPHSKARVTFFTNIWYYTAKEL